jgi:hypothetical protein
LGLTAAVVGSMAVLPASSVQAAPITDKAAVSASTTLAPRPELNGRRLQQVGDSAVYLVMDGMRHFIPDADTYTNLFRSWDGISQVTDLQRISTGDQLSSGAILARAGNDNKVYLISSGVKRFITSPQVMDKYYFNWDKVISLPTVVVSSIPSGGDIS